MDNFTLYAILQLITGTQLVPLNSSCSYIVELEKETKKKVIPLESNSLVAAADKENQSLWLYQCNTKNWSVSVDQGSYSRTEALEKFNLAYDAAIKTYDLPEKSSINYSAEQIKTLTQEHGKKYWETLHPFAVWNIKGGHLASLNLGLSSFDRGKEKVSLSFSINTNEQAQCGLFGNDLCPEN